MSPNNWPKRQAELLTAFCWYCDECGALNFCEPQRAELNEEQREEAYRHFHSMEPYAELPEGWQDFDLVESPESVECDECGTDFDVVNGGGE